jgi:hypothetical protein
MTNYLVESGVFQRTEFVLIDVGVSGGIAEHWRLFGAHLRAFGFDPRIDECVRLSSMEASDKVFYLAGLVGIEDQSHWYHRTVPGEPPKKDREYTTDRGVHDLFSRSSAFAVQRVPDKVDGPPIALSTKKIQIDKFVREGDFNEVDFIKIDTDGDDVETLIGCEGIIDSHKVLGFCVESQFYGPVGDKTNNFATTDRFLRSKGFLLFDLSMQRYSRSALPAPFEYSMAAQTKFGQLLWGDALYLRDPAAPGYEAYWPTRFSPEKLLKLACLYEIYSMPDCAAELIVAYRGELDKIVDAGKLLDFLTPPLGGRAVTYDQYLREFTERLDRFFPFARGVNPFDLVAPDNGLKLGDRIAIMEEQNAVLREALRLKDAMIEEKTYFLERLENLYANLLRQQIESQGAGE